MSNFQKTFRPLLADFLSTIFFVAIYAITGSIRTAIVVGIAAGILQIGALLAMRRPLVAMQWISLALVIVLGSASLLTANPRFVMIKPSIGYFAIALVMLRRNWLGRYLPQIVIDNVRPAILIVWGYAWSALLFALCLANLAIAFAAGPKLWAWFNGIVPLACQLLLFAVQYVSIRMLVRRAIGARAAAPSAG